MNGELFRLAVQGLRRKKRSSLLLFLVLCFSFAFAIITLSVNGSTAATNAAFRLDSFGAWDGAILNGTAEEEDFLRNEDWLEELAVVPQAGYLATVDPVFGEPLGISTGIGVWTEEFCAMGRLELQEGRFPEAEDEIVVEPSILSARGYDYELGQEITLPVVFYAGDELVQVWRSYTLCGVLRSYTEVWELDYYGDDSAPAAYLDGAFVSEAGAETLWAEAEEAVRKRSALAQGSGQEVTLGERTVYYFFTVKPDQMTTMRLQVTLHQRSAGADSPGVTLNGGSWEASEESDYHALYTALIVAVTLLAILCVYAVQLQRQVRQLALFRSLGATRWQLGRILLYETLCLCVPAMLLGAAAGWLGTWAVLRLLMFAGGTSVQVVIPWQLVIPLLLVWTLAVFGVRLFILCLALREPLTGRVAMGGRKARRYRRLRAHLVSLLSTLLGVVVLFAGVELIRHTSWLDYCAAQPSYEISMPRNYSFPYRPETTPSMITEERLAQFLEIPGITKTDARLTLLALPDFEGIEEISRFNEDERNLDYSRNRELEPWVCGEMGVYVYALPEENWADYLDLEALGVDIDAFRAGEQVVLSFPADAGGDYIFYRWRNAAPGEWVWARQSVTDIGIEAGDQLALEIYGFYESRPAADDPGEPFKRVETTVGGIFLLDPLEFDTEEWTIQGRFPYSVWCSEEFARKLLSDLPPGYLIDDYFTGSEFGYMDAELYTDETADYLSTDKAVAALAKEFGLASSGSATRETNEANRQEELQAVLMLASGGGCLALVFFLILTNTLAGEAEQERRRYGILQALGMSRRQMGAELLRTALLRGLLAAAAGWAVLGAYVLGSAYGLKRMRIANQMIDTSWSASLRDTLLNYSAAGLDLRLALLLTLGVVVLVAAVTLLSKRRLFRENLMTKLREER